MVSSFFPRFSHCSPDPLRTSRSCRFMISFGGSSSQRTVCVCFFASISSNPSSLIDVIMPPISVLSSLRIFTRWGGSTVAACAEDAVSAVSEARHRRRRSMNTSADRGVGVAGATVIIIARKNPPCCAGPLTK
jgi:hypothetical protein